MFTTDKAFTSFAVRDLAEAVAFYDETLGLDVKTMEQMPAFGISLATGGWVFVYEKPDHQPAGFTVFNFSVDDVEAAVDDLNGRGVTTKIYADDELPTDEKGIARGFGGGTDMAWFRDPSGNVIGVGAMGDLPT